VANFNDVFNKQQEAVQIYDMLARSLAVPTSLMVIDKLDEEMAKLVLRLFTINR
jgi:hypothetical protein